MNLIINKYYNNLVKLLFVQATEFMVKVNYFWYLMPSNYFLYTHTFFVLHKNNLLAL